VLAVILETSDPERLYTGLSLLVSTATDGEPTRALLGFGALFALGRGEPGAHVLEAERDAFRRTLAALWETALEVSDVWGCAGAVQGTGVDPAQLAGVVSMPQFLREVSGARLVLV
jgi:hypothetical protein